MDRQSFIRVAGLPLQSMTMDPKRLVKTSRYLSRHLRHSPERIGLELEPGGWVRIDTLLEACSRHSFALSRSDLEEVVAGNDKQRFSIDDAGVRIRANQGHSVEIDLQLEAAEPPDELFHGTARSSLDPILRDGIRKMGRHHVHLSADPDTATRVGRRHGKPVVLVVRAGAMQADGHAFFRSANGVWLTDQVDPVYIDVVPGN